MDPDIALAQLRDPRSDLDDRIDAALALAHWLCTGGYVPVDETRRGLLDEIHDLLHGPVSAADAHLDAAYEDLTHLEHDA
jgi:hypothetical protein